MPVPDNPHRSEVDIGAVRVAQAARPRPAAADPAGDRDAHRDPGLIQPGHRNPAHRQLGHHPVSSGVAIVGQDQNGHQSVSESSGPEPSAFPFPAVKSEVPDSCAPARGDGTRRNRIPNGRAAVAGSSIRDR
jgi:hypothetical protein